MSREYAELLRDHNDLARRHDELRGQYAAALASLERQPLLGKRIAEATGICARMLELSHTGMLIDEHDGARIQRFLAQPDPYVTSAPTISFQQKPDSWVCFHCGEWFTNPEHALQHFGREEWDTPACRLRSHESSLLPYVRSLEIEDEQLRNEDNNPWARALMQLEGDVAEKLRREEEVGYARGLRDSKVEFDELERWRNIGAALRSLWARFDASGSWVVAEAATFKLIVQDMPKPQGGDRA